MNRGPGVLLLTCTYRFIYCRKCAPHALATNISRLAACIFKSKWYKEIQSFYHAEVAHVYILFLLSIPFLWHVITVPAPQSFKLIWYEWPTLCCRHYHDNLPCDVVTETLTKEMLIYLQLSSSSWKISDQQKHTLKVIRCTWDDALSKLHDSKLRYGRRYFDYHCVSSKYFSCVSLNYPFISKCTYIGLQNGNTHSVETTNTVDPQ